MRSGYGNTWSYPTGEVPDGLELFDLDVLGGRARNGGGAPASTGEGELSAASLQSAVAQNTRYAQTLGWHPYYPHIAQGALNFRNMTPDLPTFTQAVSGWQARSGLTPDGVIGPATWGALRRALGIASTANATTASGAATGTPTPAPGTGSGTPQLRTMPAESWPTEAGWLRSQGPNANCTQLQHQIVLRALRDNGIQEVPRGSNRGDRIDHYTRRSGMNPPQWWCAIWVGAVYADCGALVPRGYPLTDNWLPFVQQTPCIGAAVLYGLRKKGPVVEWGDAHHIGIVAMLNPLVLTIEGNRAYSGTTNNGQAVDLGPLNRSDVLGYFHPRRADGTR